MQRKTVFACMLAVCCSFSIVSRAQTDMDAIMMNKNLFCVGGMYSHSSWKDYWEGSFKRDNENLGTVSTQMFTLMGSYGITKNLNVLFGIPYVKTNATAGTLKGMHGLQDLSLAVKWKALYFPFTERSKLSVFGVGGFSLPVTDYVIDFLPMSVGLGSKNLTLRGIVDYQYGNFFGTVSGNIIFRSNVEIDRNSYYDTRMHLTNEVDMPNVAGGGFRTGYRSKRWIAEAIVDYMKTLGGFDIRKNDMPFPSNEMNALMAGVNFKYTVAGVRGLELTGGAKYTVDGRNVGQSTMFNGGVFYIFNFNKKNKS